MLSSIGMGNLWELQTNNNLPSQLGDMVAGRLKDIYRQIWHAKLFPVGESDKSGKLRTYRKFKSDLSYESYLDNVDDVLDRVHLTRFRISNHRLNIETGRYTGINVNERICNFCNQNKIDDEKHFLLECDFHQKARLDILKLRTPQLINESTLSNIMYNTKITKQLAKFISASFKKRDIHVTHIYLSTLPGGSLKYSIRCLNLASF